VRFSVVTEELSEGCEEVSETSLFPTRECHEASPTPQFA